MKFEGLSPFSVLLDVGRSKLHAALGAMLVLHTWGQNLTLHPPTRV